MGVWIMMMYTMDFAALGRPQDVGFHQRYALGWLFHALAFGVNALIGIFLTFTIPGLDAAETGVTAGLVQLMGPLGLLVVFVSQTRINTANYALGMLVHIAMDRRGGNEADPGTLPDRAFAAGIYAVIRTATGRSTVLQPEHAR
jgi:hypothetical protein